MQDVYTRGRFRLAVCMICFLHVYGVLKCPKESQQRIVLVKSMLCKSVPNRGPWAVGCVEGDSCKWNGLMHRGKSTVGKEGRDLCKDPNSAFVLFFNDG